MKPCSHCGADYAKPFKFSARQWAARRYCSRECSRAAVAGTGLLCELDLDHLCRNTRCVNPTHLEPVTRAENTRRMRADTRRAA